MYSSPTPITGFATQPAALGTSMHQDLPHAVDASYPQIPQPFQANPNWKINRFDGDVPQAYVVAPGSKGAVASNGGGAVYASSAYNHQHAYQSHHPSGGGGAATAYASSVAHHQQQYASGAGGSSGHQQQYSGGGGGMDFSESQYVAQAAGGSASFGGSRKHQHHGAGGRLAGLPSCINNQAPPDGPGCQTEFIPADNLDSILKGDPHHGGGRQFSDQQGFASGGFSSGVSGRMHQQQADGGGRYSSATSAPTPYPGGETVLSGSTTIQPSALLTYSQVQQLTGVAPSANNYQHQVHQQSNAYINQGNSTTNKQEQHHPDYVQYVQMPQQQQYHSGEAQMHNIEHQDPYQQQQLLQQQQKQQQPNQEQQQQYIQQQQPYNNALQQQQLLQQQQQQLLSSTPHSDRHTTPNSTTD
eukprot:TRINITY_DN132403_c0_g2_i1.p1 TRINITY_DN132403_c0_g2~~TRINITY_DN132403_c0_g2_i1.p1  ORF type:complete len:414 (+),score=63.06 TRINITY_DN132403_c0_g2_i1:82-1323(+)